MESTEIDTCSCVGILLFLMAIYALSTNILQLQFATIPEKDENNL